MTKPWWIAMIIIALLTAAVAARAQTLHERNAALHARSTSLARLSDQAAQIMSSRAMLAQFLPRAVPAAETTGLAHGIAERVGLGADTIQSVSVVTSRPLGAGASTSAQVALTRESFQVRLRSVALADLGKYLGQWQAAETGWTVSRIELRAASGTTEERFDVSLDLSADVLADNAEGAQ